MYCSNCGSSIPDSSSFCPSCGASTTAAPTQESIVPPRRKKPGKKLVLLAAGALLLLSVVLFVVARSSGSAGPASKIAQAAENTFTADSFAVDFDIQYIDSQEYIFGTLWISYDPKHQDLILCGEGMSQSSYHGNEPFSFAFYNSTVIIGDFSEDYDESNEYAAIAWDQIAEEWDYDDLPEKYDFEKLEQCISSFIKKMDDEEWITSNAGYSVESDGSSTSYFFSSPNLSKFATEIVPSFEEFFLDPADYRDWQDSFLYMGRDGVDTNANFKVKDKDLVNAFFSFSYPDGVDSTTFELTFYDIGSKESKAQIEKIIDIYKNGNLYWIDY